MPLSKKKGGKNISLTQNSLQPRGLRFPVDEDQIEKDTDGENGKVNHDKLRSVKDREDHEEAADDKEGYRVQ